MVQKFIYEGQLTPVAEFDGQGNLVSIFVYGTKINVPDYIINGGEVLKVITDHLGSVRFIIKATDGQILQRMEYDSFGNVIYDSNEGFTPFGFAGSLYDPDNALIRFGARDYDQETGRWATKDSILFLSGSLNVYTYLENDPLNFIDPLGLTGKCPDQFEDYFMCQFYNLFALASSGLKEAERMAELRIIDGKYLLNILPTTHRYRTDSATITFDDTLVAIVHTHPNKVAPNPTPIKDMTYIPTGTKKRIPLPFCVYVVSRYGIWE